VPAASVPELLKSATAAVSEQRLVAPAGNNAMEFYLAVLDKDANNVQAKQAIVDIFPLSASIVEREIGQRHLDEADRIIKLLDRASPGSYTVTTIKSKLAAMRTTVEKEQTQQLAAQQAAQQQAAQKAAEAAAATAAAAKPPAKEPAKEPVAATTPPPAATAPPPPPTPAAPVGETRDATIVRQVPPDYPPEAFRKRQEGWVELEFTVGVDGKVTNLQVARAQPSHVFDREATRAMQQWTFQPALKDGKPVESRLKRRVNFVLGG
jgi:protein TonB